jgi:peptidoglycan/xylan/chitin deacetylase (PgdA/CDA1 family)
MFKHYPDRLPDWFTGRFLNQVWHGSRKSREVYLTFDDGPTPDVTDHVLKLLDEHQAKATFFCIGDNVQGHPELYGRILASGHDVGNHTQEHLNGWKTSTDEYLSDIEAASTHINSRLFRPPYGRITQDQIKRLQELGYFIVMWDVLSGDFDQNRSASNILKSLQKNVRPGSIIVMHDSVKAAETMLAVLPVLLSILEKKDLKAVGLHNLIKQSQF